MAALSPSGGKGSRPVYHYKRQAVNIATKRLFSKYIEGKCSPEETEEVLRLIRSGGFDEEWEAATAEYALSYADAPDRSAGDGRDHAALLQRVMQTINQPRTGASGRAGLRWPLIAAAAVMLLTCSIGFYLFQARDLPGTDAAAYTEADIAPGSNRAVLTLGNGKTVHLSGAQDGIIIGNDEITYSDGTAVFSPEGSKYVSPEDSPRLLSLTTPKGGQYRVVLPDGTTVLLNAASTFRYPSRFTGDTREVFLEGEGFFSVRQQTEKNRTSDVPRLTSDKIPFVVITDNQVVQVLGTEFNISAYADDGETITTLSSGAVKVTATAGRSLDQSPVTGHQSPVTSHQSLLLKPGQQSILSAAGLEAGKADISAATAWKEGSFRFNDEPLERILRRVARWYNVEIVYSRGVDKEKLFAGTVSRYERVSRLLRKLELTGGVRFQVEPAADGRREGKIIVMP